ncbi:nucleotidyltransferase domain-containing protein [Paenibacillus athensensis]|uniref:Nucleotidyltransferase n=1 Tax=Paenibacillus athensensis TaxID=1967502 RepID=A0A4Y8PXB0_9BACL|nr:nucleotidyltransferase domain-containing protein [Paenibacillus athensensis]MCD1261445.1 nucleotidyltransferase domain-containing protein [Paenibacillus athensensis]
MDPCKATILEQLAFIEREEGVRIVYACESGSRAWGFPSQNSDYDVRFVYVRPVSWYLSVAAKRDVIERPISGMLDINGWDLRKALALFRKSNPPLLEWLQSPLLYLERYTVAQRIRELAPQAFSPRSCFYHYLHMAQGNFRDYLQGEQVRIKKYFYVLRPLLACRWIERYSTMPPIDFDELFAPLVSADSELFAAVQQLLARKRAGEELDVEAKVQPIHAFVEHELEKYRRLAAKLDGGEGVADEQMDALFREALAEVWGEGTGDVPREQPR